jgi:IS5 family transposase
MIAQTNTSRYSYEVGATEPASFRTLYHIVEREEGATPRVMASIHNLDDVRLIVEALNWHERSWGKVYETRRNLHLD